jgi:hypothetical protein
MRQTKLEKLKALYVAGKAEEALCLAAKFPQLGAQKEAITRGASAITHPDFYRQIKKDPTALVAAGIQALREKYRLA